MFRVWRYFSFQMETRVRLRYVVTCCFWKMFFDSDLHQNPLNLISLTFLVSLRLFTLCQKELLSDEKSPQIIWVTW